MTIGGTSGILNNSEIGRFTTSNRIRIGTATTGPTSDGMVGSSISATSITVSEALTIGNSDSTFVFDSSGTTTLSANTSSSGHIRFDDAVNLNAAVTVSGRTIWFSSTVDGGHALVLNADLDLVFLGAVGGTTPLSSLSATGGPTSHSFSHISLHGNVSTNNGNVTFTGAVILNGDVTVSSGDGAGNISFSSWVNAGFGHSLTLDAGSGSVTVSGAMGNIKEPGSSVTKLTSLTVSGGQIDLNTVATTGNIDITGTNIDLKGGTYSSDDGNIAFRGPVDLHANVTVNSDANSAGADGNITFTSTVNGNASGRTLSLKADTGAVELKGDVGGTTKLASFTVAEAGQVGLKIE
ncbi:MAG: DUF342 domain-containing protein, partial [Gammaproteobacteria bacterium]|nr:DUF342 domain-containing protein [Gammaproteobacteria bacterium]